MFQPQEQNQLKIKPTTKGQIKHLIKIGNDAYKRMSKKDIDAVHTVLSLPYEERWQYAKNWSVRQREYARSLALRNLSEQNNTYEAEDADMERSYKSAQTDQKESTGEECCVNED